MLSPAMATMLAVLTTDAAADPSVLQQSLARAVSETFDCLSVDGCRSTNDTVIVLANGRAGAVDPTQLTDALTAVCGSLAEQMARDAEGATKFVRVRVVGARTQGEARIAARGRRQQPARAVLAQRRRRILGPRALGAGSERRVHRSRGASTSRTTAWWCAATAIACAHDDEARSPRTWRVARSSCSATCTSRTARRRCSPPTFPTRTSTRTGAPRDTDERDADRGREGDRARGGAAVHP